MHYYLDGYNLLFRLSSSEEPLQKQRDHLIEELGNIIAFLGLDVTIVFDSQYQFGDSTRSFKYCNILFTSQGETADEAILSEIKAERRLSQQIVVTSDKKLAWFARRCSVKTESVEEFIAWVNRRYKNKLRQQKQEKLEGKYPKKGVKPKEEVETTPVAPPKKVTLNASSSPEECVSYYLDQFQARYVELQEKEPIKSIRTERDKPEQGIVPRKKKVRKMSPEEQEISDMDRWLRLFEERVDE